MKFRLIKELNSPDDHPERPERKVTKLVEVNKDDYPDLDSPKAQKVSLSCGHWLINGFGTEDKLKYEIGDTVRCRSCTIPNFPREN